MNNFETDISGLKICGFHGNKSLLSRSRNYSGQVSRARRFRARKALTERTGRNKIFYAVYKKAKDQRKSVDDSTCDVSVVKKPDSHDEMFAMSREFNVFQWRWP